MGHYKKSQIIKTNVSDVVLTRVTFTIGLIDRMRVKVRCDNNEIRHNMLKRPRGGSILDLFNYTCIVVPIMEGMEGGLREGNKRREIIQSIRNSTKGINKQ